MSLWYKQLKWNVVVTFAVYLLFVFCSNRFGEESMYRVIRWMQKHKIPLDASVLDIGTGNGVFLVELVGTFSIHMFEPISKLRDYHLTVKQQSSWNTDFECLPWRKGRLFVLWENT